MTRPENRELRYRGKVCRKTIPKIGGEDWEGPPAAGSEIVGWHHKLIGIRWSKPQSGWHVGDPDEVRWQIVTTFCVEAEDQIASAIDCRLTRLVEVAVVKFCTSTLTRSTSTVVINSPTGAVGKHRDFLAMCDWVSEAMLGPLLGLHEN